MISDEELLELERLTYEIDVEESQDNLFKFTKTTFKKFKPNWFHKKYYTVLDKFAHKEIKNLIISVPPQFGKSEGSSRRLPAFITGIRPDEKIALVSYSATKAQKFGREIMTLMREQVFQDIFPDVRYPERGYTGTKSNTNENRESINSAGSLKFVGITGGLTGDPVDVLLMDDLYKDWQQANSPVIREAVWSWYLTVAETRLHNDSQQLIVFTRWSEDDLIGRLEELGKVKTLTKDDDLDELIASLKHDEFLKINFPALKEDAPNDLDPREKGESLWPERHSERKLQSSRGKDPDKFDCLYQGDPQNKEGLLYSPFKTYSILPERKIRKSYTDTADTGTDFLCTIVFDEPLSPTDPHKYVVDVLFTDESMEKTEPAVIKMLNDNNVNESLIESNNGGRSFARVVKAGVKEGVNVNWFHQGLNKESRIYSQSAEVNRMMIFPDDWHIRWPEFYKHITKFKKDFSTNKHNDGADALTGCKEFKKVNTGWGSSRTT